MPPTRTLEHDENRAPGLPELLARYAIPPALVASVEMLGALFYKSEFSYGDLQRARFALASLPLLLVGAVYLLRSGYDGFKKLTPFGWAGVFATGLLATLTLVVSAPITAYASAHSNALVTVFYATDRERDGSSTYTKFGNDMNVCNCLFYGRAQVSVPVDSKNGFFAWWSYRWNRQTTVPSITLTELSEVDFVRSVGESSVTTRHRDALILIHGFHNPFQDALLTTAGLQYELKFRGPTILYSWPSANSTGDYNHDLLGAMRSARLLSNLLPTLASQEKIGQLSVVAHSMGGLVLGEALDRVSNREERKIFDNIVFAAPDVDEYNFNALAPAVKRASRRTTVYTCNWDFALLASYALNRYPRVGSKAVGRSGMDVVDATVTAHVGLNHSYVFESPAVQNDLFLLLVEHDKSPPAARINVEDSGYGYYSFKHP